MSDTPIFASVEHDLDVLYDDLISPAGAADVATIEAPTAGDVPGNRPH
jgi:hypothetical protein